MVNLDLLLCATSFQGNINLIGKWIYALYETIGSFGWTVVAFTAILKAITLPLDLWSKHVNRKNSKAMERMKPQLEKMKKTYENNPNLFSQKQMELYKKEHYSLVGACLPTLVTLVVFLVVFSGFNSAVKYHNEKLVWELAETYNTVLVESGKTQNDPEFIAEVDAALLEKYNETNESWLWIDNIFVADNLVDSVISEDKFTGSGIGRYSADLPDNTINIHRAGKSTYEILLGPAQREYSKVAKADTDSGFVKWITKLFDFKHSNGFLILPILSVLLSIVTSKMMKKSQGEPPPTFDREGKPVNTNAGMMKAMNWMMPIMIGFFALFYSSAFSIYMFFNSLFTVVVNVVYNVITKRIDAIQAKAAENNITISQ